MESYSRDPPTEGDGAILAADGDCGARGAAASDGNNAIALDPDALATAAAPSSPSSSSSSSARLAAVVAEACSLLGGAGAAADLLQQALESLRLGSSSGPLPAGERHRHQQLRNPSSHSPHHHHHHHHHPRHEELLASHARQRHLIDSSDGSDGRALLMRGGGGYQGGRGHSSHDHGGGHGTDGGGAGGGGRSGSVSSSDGGGRSPLLLSPRPASGSFLHVVGGSGHGGTGLLAEALRAAAAAGGEGAAAAPHNHPSSSRAAARANWQRALAAAVAASRCGGYLSDPWADRKIHSRCPARLALRHRYDAGAERWTVDPVLIKMESQPFAAGAMRRCLRLKKLSTASRGRGVGVRPLDWRSAPNFVAKVFRKPGVADSAYFGDFFLPHTNFRLLFFFLRPLPFAHPFPPPGFFLIPDLNSETNLIRRRQAPDGRQEAL